MYSSSEFYSVYSTMKSVKRIPLETYNRLKQLACYNVLPTHRGTIAGRRIARTLTSRITNKSGNRARSTRSIPIVNIDNLHLIRTTTEVPHRRITVHTKPRRLIMCCLNIRSVKNETVILSYFIYSNNVNVVALTETWLGTSQVHE